MNLLRRHISINPKSLALLLLLIVLIGKIYFIVWQFSFFGFEIAPGGDPLSHLTFVKQIMAGNFNLHVYPPLYHYIIAWVSNISQIDPIFVIKYSALVLLFLGVPFFYFLAKELFGFWSAFFATLIYLVASSHPLLNFVDGNYPGMLNTGVFIPLTFVFFLRSFKSISLVNLALTVIFAALMVFTHHLTATIALVAMSSFIVVYGGYVVFCRSKILWKEYIKLIFSYLIVGGIIWFVMRQTFGASLGGAIGSVLSGKSLISNPVFTKVPEFFELPNLLPGLIEFLGFMGIIFSLATISVRTKEKLFIILLSMELWLMSRSSFSGLPPRFLRELALPLTILAGYSVASIIDISRSNFSKALISGLVGYLLIINAVQINVPPFALPGGFKDMVWYTPADQEKVGYIKQNIPRGSTIITNPFSPYLNYFVSRETSGRVEIRPLRATPNLSDFDELSQDEKTDFANNYIATQSAQYLLIGKALNPSPDEDTFSEYTGYRDITEVMESYQYQPQDIIQQFPDGSRLIRLNAKPAQK